MNRELDLTSYKESVSTLEDAQRFFLSNSSGNVKCSNDVASKVCSSYLDSVEFYKTE